MESWGFENNSHLLKRPDGFFYKPGGIGGGGKGGAPKTDEAPIPASNDKLERKDISTKSNLTTNNGEQQFVVSFTKETEESKKAKATTDKVAPNPNKTWSYRGVFIERDGIAGITNKEEAQDVKNFTEKLSSYDDLNKMDGTPKVTFYEKDADGNNSLDPETESASLDYETIVSRAERSTEETNPLLPNLNSTPVNPFDKKKLEEQEKENEALFQALLAALVAGNWDMLGTLSDVLATSSGIQIASTGATLLKEFAATNKQIGALNEELAKAQGKYSDDAQKITKRSSEITEISGKLQMLNMKRDELSRALQTLFQSNDSIKNLSNSIHEWFGRQPRYYSF